MAGFRDAPMVEADDRATWRAWLEANHDSATGAWLVTWRKGHGPVLDYGEAVEEALCFGWVDSTGGRVDDRRTKLYFAPRKTRSVWSASNKERVTRLIAAGLMRPAGLAAIERAKQNGAWSALDEVEQGIVPADLATALEVRAARDPGLDRGREATRDADRPGARDGPARGPKRTRQRAAARLIPARAAASHPRDLRLA